ncbi:hypothetical protein [Sphingosinithalassobacter sp. CS137]|uniref:hypothetical protein n=1 Tax=Sphingosinithalassobacter sp. CS137 TaxID=2762748 RepID=UPI00165DAA0D|nr:hypothetical protein [Sphingosinithalassobacter sp. CS137]
MIGAGVRTRRVRVLRIYCPVGVEVLRRVAAGESPTDLGDPTLAKMLAAVRAHTGLGDFGIYRSVIELAPGWELFTPGDRAAPAFGEPGVPAASPTLVLTVHVAAEIAVEAFARALEAILEAHPWEVPVVELGEAELLVRA